MPGSWRTRDLTVLTAAGVGTVLLTTASFLVAPPDSLPRNDGSSYAAHPDGARAAYLLLQRLGYEVERSFEPVAAIRRRPEETVLVLASPATALSEQDVKALRAFLEQGGRVLMANSASTPAFLPGLPPRSPKTARPADPRRERARRHDRALPGAITDGVESVEMVASTTPLPDASPYVVVYGTEQAPAVLTVRPGAGQATWWASSAPLANGAIGRPKHVELLVNTLGPPGARTILWDEFYHGHRRSFWSYLADTPFSMAIVQAFGIGALALLTYARRRRPIRGRVVEPRTSPLEFVHTMGGLYERAHAAAAAVATVHARLRRRMSATLGLPLASDDERLIAAAVERLALDRVEVAATLAAARAAATDASLPSREAVSLVSKLQELAARLERVGKERKKR